MHRDIRTSITAGNLEQRAGHISSLLLGKLAEMSSFIQASINEKQIGNRKKTQLYGTIFHNARGTSVFILKIQVFTFSL